MLRGIMIFLLTVFSSCELWAVSFVPGETAFICLKHPLQSNWPEYFAYQVEIIDDSKLRIKVRVINSYPGLGRVNQEQAPVEGDIMKLSRNSIYSREAAGIAPGDRFEGKPVCRNLM